tara:strand:+ start:539 stop:742 length:204 start_codon:yes stop_codon:yes gene_type:complete
MKIEPNKYYKVTKTDPQLAFCFDGENVHAHRYNLSAMSVSDIKKFYMTALHVLNKYIADIEALENEQ